MPNPKRRALALPTAARTVSVEKHEGALRTAIHHFFVLRANAIATTAAELYARATKADEDKTKRIVNGIPLDDWNDLADVVQPSLIAVFKEGGESALAALGLDAPGLFDVLNTEAAAYAKSRGAELVGMKWKDGVLVENPRSEWAITESTRDGLRDLISRAFQDGMSPTELGDAIQDSYLFSSARSDLIARTELSYAHVQGEIASMKASGVVAGKRLIPADDHDPDDCDDYFDQTFDLDDDEADPPIHPACRCSLEYVMAEEEEAA